MKFDYETTTKSRKPKPSITGQGTLAVAIWGPTESTTLKLTLLSLAKLSLIPREETFDFNAI